MIPDTSPALVPPAVRSLKPPAAPWVAAFDADGTLWQGDVSEDFTRWMIAAGHFDAGLWPAYAAVAERDPAAACFEILRFYTGIAVARLRELVGCFWRSPQAERVWRPEVLASLRWAAARGARVFIVSGTPAPVFGDLAVRLGIAGIVALELEVDPGGRATGRHAGVPTVGPGKAARLRAADPAPIMLAAGNAALDLAMLEACAGLCWAVAPDEILAAAARRHGWLITDAPSPP